MSAPIRLRRHTDGRVAIQVPTDRTAWSVVAGGGQNWVHERHVTGDGWSELLVAELPEPDDWANCVGDKGEDAQIPRWSCAYVHSLYAWNEGVEVDGGLREDLDAVRSDALKMLAAAAACERYRVEREAVS